MGSAQPFLTAVAALAALSAAALAAQPTQLLSSAVSPPGGFWLEALSATNPTDGAEPRSDGPGPEPDSRVPAVFRNGAWTPDHSTNLNAYVAVLLSKDVYFKHVIDPRDGPAARRNFTLFARAFCRAMIRLGADDCEVVAGSGSLVWSVIRAGPSVLLVVRGSNSPQNWITDVTSLRAVNVDDFGGGSRGTNVALGFYRVFSANRRLMVDRVRSALGVAEAAAAEAAANARTRGGGGGGADANYSGSAGARLWVFGHSLGGAVGLMAASYLNVREGLTVTGVFTFGCPRVGDELWAHSYQLHDVTLRLENAGDIVPTLPFGGYWRHVGSAVAIQACKSLQLPQLATATTTVAESAAMAGVVAAAAARQAGDAGAAAVRQAVRQATARRPDEQQWRRRRLRGVGGVDGPDETTAATASYGAVAAAVDADVAFPFPVSFRDHWVQTYTQVVWSCLPDSDQALVPGPADVYDKID